MYSIERRQSGYLLTFSGTINEEEMRRWYNESQRILSNEQSTSFGVIINMKDLEPLVSSAKVIMLSGQKLYKEKGMKRSAVILNSEEVCIQFKNLAIQSGIYATERYLDASSIADPIDKAIHWVKDAVDPDK